MAVLETNSYYIGAYNSSGNLDSTAFKFTYTISYGDYNVAENTTPVTINWKFTNATSGWRYNYSGIYAYVYIYTTKTGSEQQIAKTNASVHTAGVTDTLCEWTGNVEHNSDGTLGIRVRLFFDGGESNNALPRLHTKNLPSSTTTYALPNIPRASGLTLASSYTISNTSSTTTLGFTINPQTGAYHRAVVTYGVFNNTYNYGYLEADTEKTISNAKFLENITNSSTSTLTVKLLTYSDSGYTNLMGEVTKNCSLTIDVNSIKPSISTLTVSYSDGCPIGSYFVAGYSSTSCSVTDNAGYKASITNRRFSASNVTINTSTGVISKLPASTSDYSFTVTVKVTDSRGATASKSTTVNVLGYRPPKLTLNAYRCNDVGAQDLAGGYSKANGTSSVGCLSSQGNTITSTTKTIQGGSTWSNNVATTLSTSSSRTYVISATDSFGTTSTQSITVPAATFPIDLYQSGNNVGVGLGTVAEAGKVKSALPIEVNNTDSTGYIRLREDGEGGTILIKGPSGKEFEIDAYNGRYLRAISYDDDENFHYADFDRQWGDFRCDGTFIGKHGFPNDYWRFNENGDAVHRRSTTTDNFALRSRDDTIISTYNWETGSLNLFGGLQFHHYMGITGESTGSSTGVWNEICRIQVTGTYANGPMRLSVVGRTRAGDIYFSLANVSSMPSIANYGKTTWFGKAFDCKIARDDSDGTIHIWAKSPSTHDRFTVFPIQASQYQMERISVTYPMTQTTDEPYGTWIDDMPNRMSTSIQIIDVTLAHNAISSGGNAQLSANFTVPEGFTVLMADCNSGSTGIGVTYHSLSQSGTTGTITMHLWSHNSQGAGNSSAKILCVYTG